MFKKVILSVLIGSILISLCANLFVENFFIVPYSSVSANVDRKIRSTGSTSMSRLISVLSEDFMNSCPDYEYEKSETGSGSASLLVASNDADLGDMSRYMKDGEKRDDLSSKCIALDGIVIILNKRNKIENLSKQDLIDIFSKKITNWSQISDELEGNIVTIGREEASGTREGFEEGLGIVNPIYDIILPESGDISAKVSNEERAIGYISMASVSENIHSVKVDGVECNFENVKNRIYPLTRPFLQVYLIHHGEKLDKWFEYLDSDRAKKIIEKEKLVHD